MSDQLLPVIRHVIATLPPGLDDRAKLLRSLDFIVPVGHPEKEAVSNLRFGIDHHLTQLVELQLEGRPS